MKKASLSGSDRDASGIHLWLVLWRASRTLEAYARRNIEDLGMCTSDFAVLEALLHKGPQAINHLGSKVLLTSGSITTAVDRLEKLGCVERRSHPRDRRTRMVHLTPAGRKVIGKAFADHRKAMERATAALSAEERATVTRLLRKLGQDAEKMS